MPQHPDILTNEPEYRRDRTRPVFCDFCDATWSRREADACKKRDCPVRR
jgi:hypothetical protein